MDCKTFRENLAARRKALGLSFQKLADMVDTSKSHIFQIENGKSEPGLFMAIKIAKAVGLSLDDLLRKYSDTPPYHEFKHPVCRGTMVLGSNCGFCEKCRWEQENITINQLS